MSNPLEEPPDSHKTIKVTLKKILRDEKNLEVFEDLVDRTHRVTIKTYQLLRLYILDEYHKGNKLPIIDKALISLVQKAVLKPAEGNGPKCKEENAKKIKNLQKLYPFELEDGLRLRQILDYSIVEMVTSVENNIKNNFQKYVKKYVSSYFLNEYNQMKEKNEKKFGSKYDKVQKALDKEYKTNLWKDIKAIQNDIFENTTNCDKKYHSWLKKNRGMIIPTFNSTDGFYYDIKANPQKYLKHMIWINLELEKLGVKLYQSLPLRNELVPKSIRVDTQILCTNFSTLRKDLKVSNKGQKILDSGEKVGIADTKEDIWEYLFDINQNIPNYHFDYSIATDGYSVSLSFIHKDELPFQDAKKKNRAEKWQERNGLTAKEKARLKIKNDKRKKEEKEKKETERLNKKKKDEKAKPVKPKKIQKAEKAFQYFDEVDESELEGTKVFIDPGKKSLFTMLGEEPGEGKKHQKGQRLSYTAKQHAFETKRFKYQKILKDYRTSRGFIGIEEILSNFNSKSCSLDVYKEFLEAKTMVNRVLLPEYANKIFRKYAWYSCIENKRAEKKFLDSIDETFGKNPVLILGDASLSTHMRGLAPMPNLKLTRKLKKRYKVFLIDEFRTSCLHNETEEYCSNLTYVDNKVKPKFKERLKALYAKEERTPKEDEKIAYMERFLAKYKKTDKVRKLHSVLTYQMENGRWGCINRDFNACLNMKKIFFSQMETGERSLRYRRGYDLNEKCD